MERLENLKVQIGILVLVELVAMGMLHFSNITLSMRFIWGLVIFNLSMIVWIIYRFENEKEVRDIDVSRILGNNVKDALNYGKIGILTYDDNYTITWMNDYLKEIQIVSIGKKLTNWISDINELFQGNVDSVIIRLNNRIYEIVRKENVQVLYIKDITEVEGLRYLYKKEAVVAGLLQLDNYMEIQQYEDEAKMALIHTNLRQALLDWAKQYGMFVRRLRSDRFLVILNEKIFEEIMRDRFSILNQIRTSAEQIDASITLSMAYARGTSDYRLLDQMVNDLMELAQSRGGDQVAVKKYGENVKYFGGNGEAKEKRSKVRVRVMAQAMKEAIIEAKRVFIVGHKEMDFDCMGAAIGMSRLCSAYEVESYIVSKGVKLEMQLEETFRQFEAKLEKRHKFIKDEEAANMIEKNDLIIVVDHNSPNQCAALKTVEKATKIMVIDHHRRTEVMFDHALLVYIESSASSVCELISEFYPYQSSKVQLSEEEAMLMYLGILVDTNHFKMRTGSRTFEAAAYLRKIGVDPSAAENLLKENYQDFEEQTFLMSQAKPFQKNLLIAAIADTRIFHRTIMSKAADALLNIKGVEASFVVAYTSEGVVGASCRSKGHVNVQRIMEEMQGGGHFSAAALSRENTTVIEVEDELKQVIGRYLEEKEDMKDETNLTK